MSKPRHEIKLFINLSDYYTIKSQLKHIAKLDPNADSNNTYHIRSLYFDNFNDKALLEKINGYNKREKFRIRLYNFNSDFINLEKKSKENNLCYKTSALLTKKQCELILQNDIDWMLTSNNALLLEFYSKFKNQCLRPKTIVDYTREAFVYNPGNIRITIDSNIRSGLLSNDLFNDCLPTLGLTTNNSIVLEVKYDEFLPQIISDLIQINTRQATAISKYAASRLVII